MKGSKTWLVVGRIVQAAVIGALGAALDTGVLGDRVGAFLVALLTSVADRL